MLSSGPPVDPPVVPPALPGRLRDRGSLGRLRRVAGDHPLSCDIALAAAVAVFSVVSDGLDPDSPESAWIFDVALSAPLAARRRRPMFGFAAICAVAFVQWITGDPARADVAVLIGLYAVGAYEPRRSFIFAAAVAAEVGVVLATMRWAPPDHMFAAALLLTGTVTAAWVVGVYVRTRRAYLAAVLDRALTAERERDHQARLAVAAERSRIAREMHDVVAHSLSVMIALNDGAAATALSSPDETQQAVRQASAVGRQSLGEMRRLLGVLRSDDSPELEPQPDDARLGELIDQVRSAGLPVELSVSGQPSLFPPGAHLTVHRIVQESLTNVLKHAPGARHTTVRLAFEADRIDVEVTNDDHAPKAASNAAAGHGLVGMRERAAMYGGRVVAGRGDDGGWRVSTQLRLEGDAAADRSGRRGGET